MWKRGGSVLLVLLMHPVAAHALFQLARQRCAPLLDEGIRCCKLGDHVARLDDRDGIEDCVRKTHEAASEALQDGAGALASPVPSQAELFARLEHSKEGVREAAVSTLGQLDAATLAQHAPALVARLEDSESGVRKAAVSTLGRLDAFDALVSASLPRTFEVEI